MSWTNSNYPPSMKNLKKVVRDKTIEIANALKDKGYNDQRAIAIAIDRAKKWYNGRHSPEKK